MSEKTLNNRAKAAVLTPMILLIVGLLLFSSCSSTCQFTQSHSYKNRNNCPAYR